MPSSLVQPHYVMFIVIACVLLITIREPTPLSLFLHERDEFKAIWTSALIQAGVRKMTVRGAPGKAWLVAADTPRMCK